MNYKEEFLKIYDAEISRAGAKELREYLLKTDFFSAPASTRFHCAFEGGLCLHSINVYKRLMRLRLDDDGKELFSRETAAICALLHDVCKIEYYKNDFKNVKNEFGEWIKVPYYSREEKLPYGHGEKSVYIINGFLRLTREEAIAINWHMGGFDDRVRGGGFAISEAFHLYKLAVFLHIADLQATFVDEERN